MIVWQRSRPESIQWSDKQEQWTEARPIGWASLTFKERRNET